MNRALRACLKSIGTPFQEIVFRRDCVDLKFVSLGCVLSVFSGLLVFLKFAVNMLLHNLPCLRINWHRQGVFI